MSKLQERFNVSQVNKIPKNILMPVAWVGSFPIISLVREKFRRHNMKGVKPPYIILSNHASMVDFQSCIMAFFPHKVHWIVSIEEFVGREWLMRGIGGIPKRKFTTGSLLIKQILRAIRDNHKSVVIYPEARFSLAGINEDIGKALGKLVKMANVPCVVLNQKGNFIRSPQWCKHPIRHNKLVTDITCVARKEELDTLSAEEIQERIEKAFVYDDYKWQLDNKIKIRSKKRAQNLHKILYKCPVCGKEFMMESKDNKIWCNSCGNEWSMDYYGRLFNETKGEYDEYSHIPDWYKWERECVNEEVNSGSYHFEDDVRIEELFSAKLGFLKMGTVKMIQDDNGITLSGKLNNGIDFYLHKNPETTASIHIEYNFKKRGDALDINTLDGTWFVYPLHFDNVITKIHFATEALYKKHSAKQKGDL